MAIKGDVSVLFESDKPQYLVRRLSVTYKLASVNVFLSCIFCFKVDHGNSCGVTMIKEYDKMCFYQTFCY